MKEAQMREVTALGEDADEVCHTPAIDWAAAIGLCSRCRMQLARPPRL